MRWKAFVLFLAPLLHAQSVEGTVVQSGTGAPVAGASVTLSGKPEHTVTTDAAGEFRFPSVPAGEYTARAAASGFFMLPPGEKRIRVADAPVRVSFEMAPVFRVQGRVRFPDGRPAARTEVKLLYRNGGASTRTDEEGRFTITGSERSARYILAAGVPPDAIPAEKGNTWSPTFYPDAVERAQASPIRLAPGVSLSGYEIRLRSVPVFCVRGVLRDDQGKPVARAPVRLISTDWLHANEKEIASGEDGGFEFPAVRAGEWRLSASVKREDVELKGIETVRVAGRDLERVELRLARPFALRGFVERDEPRDAEGKRKLSGVALIPEEARADLSVLSFHEQDGNIVLKKVYPGRYIIHPLGFLPGYFLASVKLGDREVIGQEVELSEASPPFRVVYESNAPRVRGEVEKGEGATVVLIPRDEAFVNDQFLRSAKVDANGRFEIGSLRPGDYYAFAFAWIDWAALYDIGFVRNAAPRAVSVHVEKGQSAAIELKVLPWPE